MTEVRAIGEVRDFALRVVRSTFLEEKLAPPGRLADERPGPALVVDGPGRPPELAIRTGPQTKVPPLEGLADPAQRARIVHSLANHELQAVELFAWALLAFPDAPAAFRQGLLSTLADEQRHTRAYLRLLEPNGVRFGDFPVSGYFWSKAPLMTSPRRFVCAMCLTFENANLDHTLEYAAEARRAGDEELAAVLEEIHGDELRHVRFGLRWLDEWKAEDESTAQAYLSGVSWPLRPSLARGRELSVAARRAAGFDAEFVRLLADSSRRTT